MAKFCNFDHSFLYYVEENDFDSMCEMLIYKKGSLRHIIYDRNVFMHELLTCSLLLQYMLKCFFLNLLCRLSA